MRARTVTAILALALLIGGAGASHVAVFTSNKAGFADQEYVDWGDKLSYSYEEMIELQELLNTSHYDREYEENVFDCVSASILCEQWLEKQGYKSYILVNNKLHHAWVVVQFKDGSMIPVEATHDMKHMMGMLNWSPKHLQGYVYETAAELIVATK